MKVNVKIVLAVLPVIASIAAIVKEAISSYVASNEEKPSEEKRPSE